MELVYMSNYLDFNGLSTVNQMLIDKALQNSKYMLISNGIIDVSQANAFKIYVTTPTLLNVSGNTKKSIDDIWLTMLLISTVTWPSNVVFNDESNFQDFGYYIVKLTTFNGGLTWIGETVSCLSFDDFSGTNCIDVSSNGIINADQSNAWSLDGKSISRFSIASEDSDYFFLKIYDGNSNIVWPQNLVWDNELPSWSSDGVLSIFLFYTIDNGTTWHGKFIKRNLYFWKITVNTSATTSEAKVAEIPFSLKNLPNASLVVDWGDGTTETITSLSSNAHNPKHTYSINGVYQITMSSDMFDKMYIYGYDSYGNFILGDEYYGGGTTVASLSTYANTLQSIDTPLPRVIGITTGNMNAKSYKNSLSGIFSCCKKLVTIPDYIFAYNPQITSCSYAFEDCLKLQAIPEHTFYGIPEITSVGHCFDGCSSLTSIPENLFANCLHIHYAYSCFAYCSSISALPNSIFGNNTELTDLDSCFRKCTALRTIPETIFNGLTSLTSLCWTFYDCTNLYGFTIHIYSRKISDVRDFVSRRSGSTRTIYVPENSTTKTTFTSVSLGLTIIAE